MNARLIDGKTYAAGVRAGVAQDVAALAARGVVPGLAVVLVGEDPASQVYVRNKASQTREAGMASFEHRLPATTSEAEVLALVDTLNRDDAVDGILVQLPLPAGLDSARVIAAVDPRKDVDGLHAVNAGRLWSGLDALVPCTPLGCVMLLKDTLGDLVGREALVIGRSTLVGKPIAALLLAEHCTVTIAHSRTSDLPAVARRADILVAAAGQRELVRGDWIKPGATVIDVGIHRVTLPDGKSRLVGDVAFDEAAAVAGAITPVPGGVGPMTVACLLHNTLTACRRRRG
ncbi:MAG: bifunctional methylenetetrahydrofolate dehydrogenase/methenyltetrahydrofolate cyclohydrolase FolD [Alphaproteobacteria bacterium]|nr:bifunctional methylenetetrahydrofolate dehydrogenase/methenyltetrahydrofolate cyclohydrolase FolD [Alphaproteobacteria bacterium]